MQFPLSLQPICCSTLGHLVHKFAEFPLLEDKRGDSSLTERVAAYAFRFFVVLPILIACSVPEDIAQLPTLVVILVTGFVRRKEENVSIWMYNKLKDCLHTFVASIAFPIFALGNICLGKLPSANRYMRSFADSQHTHLHVIEALNSSEKHLAQHLMNGLEQVYENLMFIREVLLSSLNSYQLPEYSLECFPAYQVLAPLVASLSEETRLECLIASLQQRNLPMTALLWTTAACGGENALKQTQEKFINICLLCDSLGKEQDGNNLEFNRLNNSLEKLLDNPDIRELAKNIKPNLQDTIKETIIAAFNAADTQRLTSCLVRISSTIKELAKTLSHKDLAKKKYF